MEKHKNDGSILKPPPPPVLSPPSLPLTTKTLPRMPNRKNRLPFPLIFPPVSVIPPTCHPRLDSLMTLLKRDFNDDFPPPITNKNSNNDKPISANPRQQQWNKQNSNQQKITKSFNAKEQITQAQKTCHHFYQIMDHYTKLNQKAKLQKEMNEANMKIQVNEKGGKDMNDQTKKLQQQLKQHQQQQNANQQLEYAARYNYQFCLGKAACPERLNSLKQCWLQTQAAFEQHGGIPTLLEHGIFDTNTLCQKERRGVERCSGELVQQYILSVGEDN